MVIWLYDLTFYFIAEYRWMSPMAPLQHCRRSTIFYAQLYYPYFHGVRSLRFSRIMPDQTLQFLLTIFSLVEPFPVNNTSLGSDELVP